MRPNISTIIFEEHASVLAHWFAQGIRHRTVICLDAHLDLQWISPSRLERLRHASSAEQIARLAKPHHLMPDVLPDGRHFSYGIEDFFTAAAHLQLIDHLVWIAPPHVIHADAGEAISQLQQCDGVTVEDLETFHRVDATANDSTLRCWIEGRLLGLPLTICDIDTLPLLDLPTDTLVDIDIDYFVDLPSERIGVDPDHAIAVLRSLPLNRGGISICRSVASGFTPAEHGHLADIIAARWSGKDTAASLPVRASDAAEDLLSFLGGLAGRDRPLDVELLGALASRPPALDPTRAALESAALGLLWCRLGEIDRATDCYQNTTSELGSHPELAMEIGKIAYANGQLAYAQRFFDAAIADDKTQTAASLHLGLCHLRRHPPDFQRGIDRLAHARKSAPAWDAPPQLLSQAHAAAGQIDLAQEAQRQLVDTRKRIANCITRLNGDPNPFH